MSRPSRWTVPAVGGRWPVIRLNRVDLPAPLGPITAAICRLATERVTSETARNPPNDLLRCATSSTARASQLERQRVNAADDAAREGEQQHQQDRAEHERPVLRVVGDILIEPYQRRRADRRAPEEVHAAQDGHDHDLGRLRPEHVIGEYAAAEYAI